MGLQRVRDGATESTTWGYKEYEMGLQRPRDGATESTREGLRGRCARGGFVPTKPHTIQIDERMSV
eukprot:2645190-Pleurochrysis_carterae.AAC.1